MALVPIQCAWEELKGTGEGGLVLLGTAADREQELLDAYRGRVQMVYIDPPFMTGQRFQMRMRVGATGWADGKQALALPAYEDIWTDRAAYDYMMERMLRLAQALLCKEGTVFLHIDSRTYAPMRLMMDRVFGENNFLNEIIWTYQSGGRSLKYFSRKHDILLFYRKSAKYFFDISQLPLPRQGNRDNHMRRGVDEEGRPYRAIRSGGKEYLYYDDQPVYPGDVWDDISHLQQKDPQRTGYDTQKPQRLLERILACTTRPGDVVADLCFGSGTTLAAAAGMNRRFVGVDMGRLAQTVVRKRLLGKNVRLAMPQEKCRASATAELSANIGFYELTLTGYRLPREQAAQLGGLADQGDPLLGVDQWSAGFVRGNTFHALAHAARTKATPDLKTTLEVPMFEGQIAFLIVDVFGGKQVYAWTEREGGSSFHA